MIVHIVLFQFGNFSPESDKTHTLKQIQEALEALPPQIDCIRTLSVHLNDNPQESFDLALRVEVDTYQDLETYSQHPAHQQVAKELIRPYLLQRACVDYTENI